jgi:glycine/D-amino acid oxidase-like deaminating enzyme
MNGKNIKTQHYSYWELNQYFNNIDLIVIGSGIVGLNAAISYKERFPKSKVLVLERGLLPYGASTKNAGFACFGSISELLDDMRKTSEEAVWQTVEMRYQGLQLLKKRLGEKHMDYRELGGYELFSDPASFEKCLDALPGMNRDIAAITGSKHTYSAHNKRISRFGFKGIEGLILNKKEGQIDTGLMMQNLLALATGKGVTVLNSMSVKAIKDEGSRVAVDTGIGTLYSRQLVVATNGFAAELLKRKDVKPARAQVLITKPIEGLKIKGTFHYEEGYYYFRNIHNRVLFGGGRNLDMQTETTGDFALNPRIQKQLDKMLKTMILPGTPFEVEHRWCGIMGVGEEKKPIIKKISSNVVCAVRMGGMGVAIGSLVGQLAVDELVKG